MNSILKRFLSCKGDTDLAAPGLAGWWSPASPLRAPHVSKVLGMGELLTVEDAAGRAQVHPETVKRAIRSGRLRASRLGERGAYRIREEWFDDWIDAQTVSVDTSVREQRTSAVRGPRMRGRLAVSERMGRST